MAGSQVEKDAILEKGKKMIYATSSATVPKQTVVTRKAYGAGIYAMGGPAYDPESVIGLPSGEIGIMGPEAAINAVYARKLAAIDDPEERAETEVRLREEYREDIDIHRMASEVVIDEIVPPSTLRENWLPASRSTRTWRRTCRTRNTGRSSDSPDYSAVAHSGPSSPRAPPNPRATAIPTASSAPTYAADPTSDAAANRGAETDEAFAVGTASHPRVPGTAFEAATAGRPHRSNQRLAPSSRSLPTGTTASDVGSASNRRTATKTTDWPTVAPITAAANTGSTATASTPTATTDATNSVRAGSTFPTSAPSSANTTKTATAP